MSYIVLARKYRPQNFEEVYAQDHVTKTLRNAIDSDRIAHAYLFTGSRGVGKTSLARIMAKSLNCKEGPTSNPCNVCENCHEITDGISPDVIEIDGASNTGVDDIRDLQKELMYTASKSKYKIYIIDEVHMLSKSAFNALLKTLEEPPQNVIFIFATTEPHKLPPTIISRCQRYDFKRIPIDSIVARLQDIVEKEKITISEESLFIIARKAEGGMRDALSLMDQVISTGTDNITTEQVLSVFGVLSSEVYLEILSFLKKKQSTAVIKTIHQIFERGNDVQEFLNGLLETMRSILLIKVGIVLPEIPANLINRYKQLAADYSEDDLMYLISYLIKLKNDIKTSSTPMLLVEMVFIKLARLAEMHSIEELISNTDKITAIPQVSQATHAEYKDVKKEIRHISTDIVKETIINDVHKEKEKFSDLTKEMLEKEWPKIVSMISKKHSVMSAYLKQAEVYDIKHNLITITVNSTLARDMLKKNQSVLEKVFSDYLDKEIQVTYKLVKKKVKEKVINPTVQQIRKDYPGIADFIEASESEVTTVIEKKF